MPTLLLSLEPPLVSVGLQQAALRLHYSLQSLTLYN